MFKKLRDDISKILFSVNLAISVGLFGIQFLSVANAQSNSAPITLPSPVTNSATLIKFLCNVISWMVLILIAVSIIMIVVAAFQYVTAGDDTEKTSKARRTITYAAIGIAVGLIAYGFPQIVASVFPTSVSVTAFSCG